MSPVDPHLKHWYAFISAQPMPELDERVHVGLVFGNGDASRLEFLPRLPRLSGLVSTEEIEVYEAMLAGLKRSVERRVSLDELRTMLGSQLDVSEPRRMYEAPTAKHERLLVKRYLATPRTETDAADAELITKASALLDESLEAIRPKKTDVLKDFGIKRLYEANLARFITRHVPTVSRVLRSTHTSRDLIVQSASVEFVGDTKVSASGVPRGSEVFFAYKELKGQIKKHEGYSTRRVGVLHPTRGVRNEDVEAKRRWAFHLWEYDADVVIDGDRDDVTERLRQEAAWVSGNGSNGT